jgi:hypothetical protein
MPMPVLFPLHLYFNRLASFTEVYLDYFTGGFLSSMLPLLFLSLCAPFESAYLILIPSRIISLSCRPISASHCTSITISSGVTCLHSSASVLEATWAGQKHYERHVCVEMYIKSIRVPQFSYVLGRCHINFSLQRKSSSNLPEVLKFIPESRWPLSLPMKLSMEKHAMGQDCLG